MDNRSWRLVVHQPRPVSAADCPHATLRRETIRAPCAVSEAICGHSVSSCRRRTTIYQDRLFFVSSMSSGLESRKNRVVVRTPGTGCGDAGLGTGSVFPDAAPLPEQWRTVRRGNRCAAAALLASPRSASMSFFYVQKKTTCERKQVSRSRST
eukprot:2785154-Prymnesium_polylepis.1